MTTPGYCGVAISSGPAATYPEAAPFHPSAPYAEYPFAGRHAKDNNPVYDLVRRSLVALKLDAARYDARNWNPLRDLAPEGGRVLIKPNLVLDRHPRGGDLRALIAHGSVVRAALDYANLAVGPGGELTVGDSPLQTTDFAAAVRNNGLREVVEWYRETARRPVRLADFRQVVSTRDEGGHIVGWREQAGDERGYVEFDLGADSALHALEADRDRFRISNYRPEDTLQYHTGGSHRYVMARSVLDANLIITVPKLKTHCKVGVTLALKNSVGMVGRKQCLAHHRDGGAAEGGDEYPGRSLLKKISQRLESRIDGLPAGLRRHALKFGFRVNERLLRDLRINAVRDGGWYGNDTCWRMTLDLMRIALYGRPDGRMADEPQRRMLCLVDGVIGGENEGPLEATPVASGSVMASLNPLACDIVAARWMGFDYRRIPLLREALRVTRWPLLPGGVGDIQVMEDGKVQAWPDWSQRVDRAPFKAPAGWVGHMEWPAPSA